MKRALATFVAVVGILPVAFGAFIEDDFETGQVPGEAPAGWDQTYLTNAVPAQANLVMVESGVGVDDSQGLSFDLTQALPNYVVVKADGVDGTELTMKANIRVSITADSVTNDPANVNSPVIGLAVKTNAAWWAGNVAYLPLCRRTDNAWGFRVPLNPWVEGTLGNAALGLPPNGLEAATSDWFTVQLDLTDNGSAWTAIASLMDMDGTTLLTTTPQPLGNIPSGATLYGTFSTSWNEGAAFTNETKTAISEVDLINIDNFSFGGSTLAITDVSVEDTVGYAFTSIDGEVNKLQYSLDGTNFVDTGAYVKGDGSEKILVDPATDTSGRSYRVLGEPGGTLATFDWEEFDGLWWSNGYNYVETDMGVDLVASGRASANDGADGAGGVNGFGFKASYFQDELDGTYVVLIGGVTQEVGVVSIDISGDGNNPNVPAGDLLVRGMLGGVEQWAIDPVEDSVFHTYTSATTGDMLLPIDQVIWSAPYDPANPSTVLVWNNKIDNMVIALDPAEIISSTATTLVDSVVVEAQRFALDLVTQLQSSDDLAAGDWSTATDVLVAPGSDTARYVDPDSSAPAGNYGIGEEVVNSYFFDDFEGPDMGWTPAGAGPTLWEQGTPNFVSPPYAWITNAASGTDCWGTDLDYSYLRDTDITLTSPVIDLSGATSATLEWMERRDIDDTTDEGMTYVIDVDAGTTHLVHSAAGPDGGEWTQVSVSVPSSAMGGMIQVQFRLKDDGISSAWGGLHIDDVQVRD